MKYKVCGFFCAIVMVCYASPGMTASKEGSDFSKSFIQNHISHCVGKVSKKATKTACTCQAERMWSFLSSDSKVVMQYLYESGKGNLAVQPTEEQKQHVTAQFGRPFADLNKLIINELNSGFNDSLKSCDL